jgi:hypothetical protein
MYIQPGSFEELALGVGEVVLIVGAFILVAYVGVSVHSWWKQN